MIANTRFSVQTEVSRQQKLGAEIAQLQIDISSGVRVHVASDDPAAARRIAQIRAAQANQATWQTNITLARQVSSQAEDSLDGVQTTLTRARELMLAANTGTASASDRAAIAAEMRGLVAELDTAASATDSTGTPLYVRNGSPDAIPVGPDVAIAASDGYDRVFGSVAMPDGSTTSLQAILTGAVAALDAGDTDAMAQAAAGIDAGQSHISVVLTDAGVRTQRIDAAADRLATAKTDLADERSSLEDTDVTSAAAELVGKQTQLQAAQAILAQLARNTLFDKLA